MNAPQMLRERRAREIAQIQSTLNKNLDEGKTINFQNFIIASCAGIGISERTVKEYLKIAMFNLGVKEENLEDESFVKVWSETKNE